MSSASMVSIAAAGTLTSSAAAAANSQQVMPANGEGQTKIQVLVGKVQVLANKAMECNADFNRIYNAFQSYWESANAGQALSNPFEHHQVSYYPYSVPIYYGTEPSGPIANLIKKEDALVLKSEIDQKLHAKAPALILEVDQLKQEFDKIDEKQGLLLLQPETCAAFSKSYDLARQNLGFYRNVKGSFHIMSGSTINVISSRIVCLQEEVNFAIAGQRPLPPAPGPNDLYSLQPSRCTIM